VVKKTIALTAASKPNPRERAFRGNSKYRVGILVWLQMNGNILTLYSGPREIQILSRNIRDEICTREGMGVGGKHTSDIELQSGGSSDVVLEYLEIGSV
jgi:predicted secreted protein